jgi:hypothetical protein
MDATAQATGPVDQFRCELFEDVLVILRKEGFHECG